MLEVLILEQRVKIQSKDLIKILIPHHLLWMIIKLYQRILNLKVQIGKNIEMKRKDKLPQCKYQDLQEQNLANSLIFDSFSIYFYKLLIFFIQNLMIFLFLS